MSFQKIFILGAGAIGSCYAAFLSGKNDVTLIGRRAHADAINSNGLVINGDLEGTFNVKAETRISALPANSLIVLTTKAQGAVKAVKKLMPLLGNDAVLLVLQNGLAIKELIQEVTRGEVEAKEAPKATATLDALAELSAVSIVRIIVEAE